MIRLEMIRQNTNDPDQRRRHPSRASCAFGGQRYETAGPAPIYKLTTLLWLHGHSGEEFEVWDDRDPFGKPGGLAMTGRVRNWARLVKGKPAFDKDAPSEANFSSGERDMVARAVGRVAGLVETDSPRPDNARTGVTRPPGGPDYPQEQDGRSTGVVGVQTPEAA